MINSQSQKGGDGSNNFQSQQMVVHVGIDEKRAREIYQEMNLQLRSDYSREALAVANQRVLEFENRLMPKMDQVDGALEAFADPSFQMLLVEAQKTAASTERVNDYDLLSELMIHRFQKGANYNSRAGISRAVEIVDKVSDDALLGLTVMHAVAHFLPRSGDIHQGLDVLNELFGKLLYGVLPIGQEWLDHLDILDALRFSSFGSLKKVSQYYVETLHGYVDVGIQKDSENHKKAIQIMETNGLPISLLCEHVLNREYLRIFTPNRVSIKDLQLVQLVNQNGTSHIISSALSEEQRQSITSIFDLYSNDGNLKQNNVSSFMVEWDKRPNLKILREWWDSISISVTVTSVGRALAHSNAQRCDRTLPPLD